MQITDDKIDLAAEAIYNCALEKYARPRMPEGLKLRRWSELTPDDYEVPMHREFARAAFEVFAPMIATAAPQEK